MTQEGKNLWEKLEGNHQDKGPFSNFETGGMEVKSTCGSVPTPAQLRKKGLRKPEIGDSRIDFVRGYDWKAHHRETNNLIGIFWDFIDEKPVICGLFYGENLEENDWGKIVQPKQGGGRTTSVSIMARPGIYKMYQSWIAVIDDPRYIKFFDKYNRASLIEDFLNN
ncbi:bsaAI [Candidatus Peregrinibacteria bacterium]|nr:MAG: bsaAI [Candidatus Peregrinibacteria bacterium]